MVIVGMAVSAVIVSIAVSVAIAVSVGIVATVAIAVSEPRGLPSPTHRRTLRRRMRRLRRPRNPVTARIPKCPAQTG
jgi:hypothetical protein